MMETSDGVAVCQRSRTTRGIEVVVDNFDVAPRVSSLRVSARLRRRDVYRVQVCGQTGKEKHAAIPWLYKFLSFGLAIYKWYTAAHHRQ